MLKSRRQFFRPRFFLALVTLASSVLVPAKVFSASAAAPPPTLIHGTLLDGSSPSAKSFVQVYVIDPAESHTPTALTPVATTQSANDGTFTINAAPTGEMTRLANQNDGWVNLWVYTVEHKNGKSYTQVQILTRLLPGATTHSLTTRTDASTYGVAPDDAPSITVQMTDASTAVSADSDPTQLANQPANQGGATAKPGADPGCYRVGTAASEAGDGIVSEIHAVGNMNAQATYGNTADSNVEAAVDFAIPDYGISFGGSVHVGNSTSITATINRGLSYGGDFGGTIHGQIGMHKDKYECSRPYRMYYQYVATQWNGNTAVSNNHLLGLDHQCWRYPESQRWQFPANSIFTHDSISAHTWGGGFSALAFHFNIKSGFSTEVKKSYHFGSSTAVLEHWLCGDTTAPLQSGRTYAGAT